MQSVHGITDNFSFQVYFESSFVKVQNGNKEKNKNGK